MTTLLGSFLFFSLLLFTVVYSSNPCQNVKSLGGYCLPSSADFPENITAVSLSYLTLNEASISVSLFSDFTSLVSVDLSHNHLSSLSSLKTLFAYNILLESVDLSFNQLTTIPSTIFDNNAKINSIDLSNNEITYISSSFLANIPLLEDFDLSSNPLSPLSSSPSLFANIFSLKFLKIHSCGLTSLPYNLFSNQVNLSSVLLQNNSISSLPTSLFENNPHLSILFLGYNPIGSFLAANAGFFAKNTELQDVYLDYVGFSDSVFDPLLLNLTLKKLNLAKNDFISMPSFTSTLRSNLAQLVFADNRLSSLTTSEFSGDNYPSLKFLNLEDNLLVSLPQNLFMGASSLQTLLLSGNPFTTLHQTLISDLISLRALSLSHTSLSSLPALFFQYNTNLREIDLGANTAFLSPLPSPFDPLGNYSSLFKLSLDSCGLYDFDISFWPNLSVLSSVMLQNNEFSTFRPGIFDVLHHVTKLNLANNNLNDSMLSSALFDVVVNNIGFTVLDLRNNSLKTLESVVFDIFSMSSYPQLQLLLDGNPLPCSYLSDNLSITLQNRISQFPITCGCDFDHYNPEQSGFTCVKCLDNETIPAGFHHSCLPSTNPPATDAAIFVYSVDLLVSLLVLLLGFFYHQH